MEMFFNPVLFFAFSMLGAALLWAVRLVYGGRGRVSEDIIKRALLIAGWILLIAGILIATGGLAGPLVLFPLFALVALILGYFKYMAGERRALLWMLAVAVEKGIPLQEVARAFAHERSVQMGLRASRLADRLEEGIPLPVALTLSRNPLPVDALLAARIGAETGRLGEALRTSLHFSDLFDETIRSIFAKCCYVLLVFLTGIGVLSFMMMMIVPVFTKMFKEFELELPAATMLIVVASEYFIKVWFLLLIPILMIVTALVCVGIAYYIGASRYEVPVVQRLWLRCDSSLVMRSLAVAVRDGEDLATAISRLTRLYPRPSIGKRLERASDSIGNGVHWAQALRNVRLIKGVDLAVLQSAERVGNLAWALDEMADSTLRRFSYRLQAVVNVVFPIIVLGFGLTVGFFVIAMFLPLLSLIQGLS